MFFTSNSNSVWEKVKKIAPLLTLLAVAHPILVLAQTPKKDALFTLKNPVQGIAQPYTALTNTCAASTNFWFNKGVVAEFQSVMTGTTDTYIIYLKTRRDEEDTTEADYGYYCISKANFDRFFTPYERIDFGLLAVPYKARFSPFQFSPGGTIGGYVGQKNQKLGYSVTNLLALGLSATAVNQPASDNTNVEPGITLGAGKVLTFNQTFQLGALVGLDLFDGVNTWVYKYQPWVSFSIGTTFTASTK